DVALTSIPGCADPAICGANGAIWTGKTTEFDVSGDRAPCKGEQVCISGATSGLHCDMKVEDVDYNAPLMLAEHTSRTEYVDGPNGHIETKKGDSGGPIFTSAGATTQPATVTAPLTALGVHLGASLAPPAPKAGIIFQSLDNAKRKVVAKSRGGDEVYGLGLF